MLRNTSLPGYFGRVRDDASMRPQRDAAEYGLNVTQISEFSPRFNEAAA